jgi:hypothetical protein
MKGANYCILSMIIGCDIGGIVKELTGDGVIEGAVETLLKLKQAGHRIFFISKCGSSFAEHTTQWLNLHGLGHDVVPIVFCENYADKVVFALKLGVQIMIDDKLTVLKHFDSNRFIRLWFCLESKNIAGAKKYDPDFYNSVKLVQSWSDIEKVIDELSA